LEERTRERVPQDWAAAQASLGDALFWLGVRESGTARLQEAVVAYRAALEERTRERVPQDWAAAQASLGDALSTLGARETGTARLEEAVVAYRAALEERTRERVPQDWAAAQASLGDALSALGARERRVARLEEAVAAYRAALEEQSGERVALDWAAIKRGLVQAQVTLGFGHFNSGDFVAAALILQDVADGTSAYPILWLYLARARIGEQNSRKTLQDNSATLSSKEWPFPVVELFLERRTSAEMVAAAVKPNEVCEAQFYLGQWHLLRDERAESIEALRKAVETCPKDFDEFAGAVAELKRFGHEDSR
jgi:tetratricopeptide (TPR) repeat protein